MITTHGGNIPPHCINSFLWGVQEINLHTSAHGTLLALCKCTDIVALCLVKTDFDQAFLPVQSHYKFRFILAQPYNFLSLMIFPPYHVDVPYVVLL